MKNKTWGGRFEKALNPLVVKFNASLPFDFSLYMYDILGSKAHVRMLARQSLLTMKEAELINKSLDEIYEEFSEGVHEFDETYEDIHMYIEHLLIEKIGDVGKKCHTGRSRNDQVALDLKLYARDAGEEMVSLLDEVLSTFQLLMKVYENDLVPGYTHLQQAQPIFLGQYFGAYHAMFSRDKSRLLDWHERMNYSPLGAGALAGSQLPLDREWLAKSLNFTGVSENTIDAVSDRDYVIELCSIASIIMMHLSRLCEDLIIWATQEFNFIKLDDAFATGSSLMPNKKNPDVLELIRGKSGRVFGHLMGILTVMKSLPLAYNKDMQEDKECLFDTLATVFSCLEIISPFLMSVTFNTDIMHAAASSGYLEATSIVEELVQRGVAFREAHHKVGEWVKIAEKTGRKIRDVMKEDDQFV